MDISLLITGAMTLLTPILEKAGEEAAKTIGKKVAEKTIEKKFWKQIKHIFIIEDEKTIIETIENKQIATSGDIEIIEKKLTKHVKSNPQFAAELQASFGLSSTNMFLAEQLLISIKKDRQKLVELFQERGNAGIETEGSYDNMISRTSRRLGKDEKRFLQLMKIN